MKILIFYILIVLIMILYLYYNVKIVTENFDYKMKNTFIPNKKSRALVD